MKTNGLIIVRQGVRDDISQLLAVEEKVYGPLGTPLFDTDHFLTWFEVHPEGLLVAESDGRIVGYKYSQLVDFDFDRMHHFTTYSTATDDGYTRRTHRPYGNSFKGVSLASCQPGAGRALFETTFDLIRKLGKRYYFSFTRMSGFDTYMREIEATGSLPMIPLETLALWYARQCAKLVNGTIWPNVPAGPQLDLPTPKPDPVLCKQLRLPNFGIAGVRTSCMRDPQSRDTAAFMVFKNLDLA